MKIAPVRTIAVALLVGLSLFLTLPLSAAPAASKEPGVEPVRVTYFFLPG